MKSPFSNFLLSRGMQFNLPLWSFLVLAVARISGIFAQRCPFPGIPANAHAIANSHQPVTWKRRTSYRGGDEIEFICDYDREIPSFHQSEIQCRNDGTWSGPIPRCGQFERLKLFTEFITFLSLAELKTDWEGWTVHYQSSNQWKSGKPESCSNPPSSHWEISRARNANDAITEILIDTCPDTFVLLI
jgi:Sushi repeat (SCR repeat)